MTNERKFFKKLFAIGVLSAVTFTVAGVSKSNTLKVPVGIVCLLIMTALILSVLYDMFKDSKKEDIPESNIKEPVVIVPNRSAVVL